MSGRIRVEYPGAVYHVYARGNSRRSIYLDDRDRLQFLEYMGRVTNRFGFIYHSYCLMGNHYHLLLETPEANLSIGMHWLDSSYANYFNWRHEHVGHVFQGRFRSIVVQRETYLLELSRYIVLNPVRAGLTSDPEDHYWSSFRTIAGLSGGPDDLVSKGWILSLFGDDEAAAVHSYATFVRDGIDSPSPLKKVVGGTVLGDAAFRRRIRLRVLSEMSLGDVPINQRDAFRPDLDELFETRRILSREERDSRVRSACVDWLYSRTQIAAYCGISLSTVSRLCKN